MMKEIDLGSGFVLMAEPADGIFEGGVRGRLWERLESGTLRSKGVTYLRPSLDDCVGAALQDLRLQRHGPYPSEGEDKSSDGKEA